MAGTVRLGTAFSTMCAIDAKQGYETDPSVIHVATFYRFVPLDDPEQTRTRIEAWCRALDLLGTVLVAREGVNATLAGPYEALAQLVADLAVDPPFRGLRPTWTTCKHAPFRR